MQPWRAALPHLHVSDAGLRLHELAGPGSQVQLPALARPSRALARRAAHLASHGRRLFGEAGGALGGLHPKPRGP